MTEKTRKNIAFVIVVFLMAVGACTVVNSLFYMFQRALAFVWPYVKELSAWASANQDAVVVTVLVVVAGFIAALGMRE